MKSDVLEFVENGQVATSSPAQAEEQQQQQQALPTPQVTTPVRPVRDVYITLSHFVHSNTNTKTGTDLHGTDDRSCEGYSKSDASKHDSITYDSSFRILR